MRPTLRVAPTGAKATGPVSTPHQQQGPFCAACLASTTDSPLPPSGHLSYFGGAAVVLGVGRYGHGSECPFCGSFTSHYFFSFFFVPVLPLNTYRLSADAGYGREADTDFPLVFRTMAVWWGGLIGLLALGWAMAKLGLLLPAILLGVPTAIALGVIYLTRRA